MSAGGSYQVKVTKELFGPYAYQLGKNMAYLCVKLSSHYTLVLTNWITYSTGTPD